MGVPSAASRRRRRARASVLELRVHGVNNTPVTVMLNLPADEVELVREPLTPDDLTGFWTPVEGASAVGEAPQPREVVREAYTWGGLNRSVAGIPGVGLLSTVVSVAQRIGWALLLPFGLVNIAFWSRPTHGWLAGRVIRGFALLLTMLSVLAACQVAMDLVATQCFAIDDGRPVVMCRTLPEQLHVLASLSTNQRLALSTLVPVVLLAGLAFVSRNSVNRYERYVTGEMQTTVGPPDRPGPLLAQPRFWSGCHMVPRGGENHVAASLGLVTLLTSVPGAWASGASPSVRTVEILVSLGAGVCAFVAVLGVVGPLHDALATGRAPDRDVTRVPPRALVLPLVGLLLAVQTALLWSVEEVDVRVSAWLDAVVGVAVGLAMLMVAGLLLAPRRPGAPRWSLAWRGHAPAALMLLALTVNLTISSMTTLSFGDWLNGQRAPAELVEAFAVDERTPPVVGIRTGETCPVDCVDVADADLHVAPVFAVTGLCAIVTVPLLLLALTVVAGFSLSRPGPGPAFSEREPVQWWGRRVGRSRRVAALAHRAEPAVVLVAAIVAGVLVPALVSYLLGDTEFWGRFSSGGLALLVAASGALLAGLVATGGSSGTRSGRPLGLLWDLMSFVPRAAHPFGPPCYAERAVPEIMERVTTWLDDEPAHRYRPLGPLPRGVVLSGHSMGAALCVAAVLGIAGQDDAAPPREADRVGRLALLTYGSQLRAYFGRILPGLLGPDVIGTAPCEQPTLGTQDPWARDLRTGPPAAGRPDAAPPPFTLASLLGAAGVRLPLRGEEPKLRWRSLWRRTDYLGFPVHGYHDDNAVDRRADEVVDHPPRVVVDEHSDYPLTPQYAEQLELLVRLLLTRRQGRGGRPPRTPSR